MTGPIMLDSATSAAVQEAADAFMCKLREIVAPHGPKDPVQSASFVASVACQAAVRGLVIASDAEVSHAVLVASGEGLGMLLGLIEDPLSRMTVFQNCVYAMNVGLQSQARIHQPQGEA